MILTHDLVSFQHDLDFGLFELDGEGDCLTLIQPKQEATAAPTCCQLNTNPDAKEEVRTTDGTVPESSSSDITVADLVGMECESLDSLDDLWNLKDFSKEFKDLNAEPEMLGCEMWEETFTEVLFPSLLVVWTCCVKSDCWGVDKTNVICTHCQ